MPGRHLAALLPLALAACAAITDGNEQTILIASSPTRAACDITRDGALLATIAATPMSVAIPTAREQLVVTCRAPGYPDATVAITSITPPGAFGRWIAGGEAGRAIDGALGGDFRYPGTIVVPIAPPTALPRRLPLAH
jgi:hypothetical protein